jgi:hypothetical protein
MRALEIQRMYQDDTVCKRQENQNEASSARSEKLCIVVGDPDLFEE